VIDVSSGADDCVDHEIPNLHVTLWYLCLLWP
jgi:hypothetical protein